VTQFVEQEAGGAGGRRRRRRRSGAEVRRACERHTYTHMHMHAHARTSTHTHTHTHTPTHTESADAAQLPLEELSGGGSSYLHGYLSLSSPLLRRFCFLLLSMHCSPFGADSAWEQGQQQDQK